MIVFDLALPRIIFFLIDKQRFYLKKKATDYFVLATNVLKAFLCNHIFAAQQVKIYNFCPSIFKGINIVCKIE